MSFLSVIRRSAPKLIKTCIIRPVTNGVPNLNKKEIEVTFVRHDGTRIKTKGKVGESFLDVVVNNDLSLEGFGACEGTLTCSTCHLVFKKEDFDQLPDRPEGEEGDMLELARGVTDTSRLGCQVFLTENMDGIVVDVPESSNDARLQ
ncbi:adrenodoxin-like protein 2, mitochondrial [Tribolium madens]|uniref:adrenodoxin-like protein 2, mitochondrial n=1 Tax=Tribolium madens TaxID=41895 RepID=UPI001CF7536C|nr:adrenodoxin-like protein 2, mitochondrial [Tribolium madens]